MAEDFRSEKERVYQEWKRLHELYPDKFRSEERLLYARRMYWAHSLNNFFTRIPESSDPLDCLNGGIYKALNKSDTVRRDFTRPTDYGKYSDLMLNQTPREFLSVINEIADFHHLDKDKFRQTDSSIDRNQLAFPIFVHLIALGYNRLELVI